MILFFYKEQRNLFVCEDISPKELSKDEKSRLAKFFSFIGSHKQVDIICISQNCTDILPSMRRLANYCFLFKNHDIKHTSEIAKKINITPKQLHYIFNNICTTLFDSLLIDETRSPEYRLRKNVYQIIKLPELK